MPVSVWLAWARMNPLRRELTSACAANGMRVSSASVCDPLRCAGVVLGYYLLFGLGILQSGQCCQFDALQP